jgi:acetyl-CoA carboxylase carboxyl transferase subunit alpha
MEQYYLDFENPLKEIDLEILELESEKDSPDGQKKIAALQTKLTKQIQKIHGKLSRWEKVQLARHPQRPYTLDYIQYLAPDFIELHGDRHFSDDTAIIAGFGHIGDRKVAILGQQKGRNTKENLYRNFGMMRPDGYRKAMRIMKLAEKFNIPIISLIDTPGAYPGLGAEERGQGEAIAKNLLGMSALRVPIISIVIGEGASGGALGIGVCDRMIMLENTWYSVISPEGCASILFRDASKAPDAAEALKVIPNDLKEIGICDRIVEEVNGGAHRDFKSTANILKKVIHEELDALNDISPELFLDNRIEKYDKLGYFETETEA